jgi:hypothetical protein
VSRELLPERKQSIVSIIVSPSRVSLAAIYARRIDRQQTRGPRIRNSRRARIISRRVALSEEAAANNVVNQWSTVYGHRSRVIGIE